MRHDALFRDTFMCIDAISRHYYVYRLAGPLQRRTYIYFLIYIRDMTHIIHMRHDAFSRDTVMCIDARVYQDLCKDALIYIFLYIFIFYTEMCMNASV